MQPGGRGPVLMICSLSEGQDRGGEQGQWPCVFREEKRA